MGCHIVYEEHILDMDFVFLTRLFLSSRDANTIDKWTDKQNDGGRGDQDKWVGKQNDSGRDDQDNTTYYCNIKGAQRTIILFLLVLFIVLSLS